MGAISQRLRDKDSQAVAAPLAFETIKAIDEVADVLKGVVSAFNEHADEMHARSLEIGGKVDRWLAAGQPAVKHLHLLEDAPDYLVLFALTPERLLSQGFGSGAQGWIAQVSPTALEAGGTSLRIALLRWVVNGHDGKTYNLARYQTLRDGLVEHLGAIADTRREVKLHGRTYITVRDLDADLAAGVISAKEHRQLKNALRGDPNGMKSYG